MNSRCCSCIAPSPASGGTLAEKLLQELAQPFTIGGHETKISASIGIAVCPVDAATPDELLKKADLALYHAKNSAATATTITPMRWTRWRTARTPTTTSCKR
jgi:GGDEF domain-containing protein